MSRRWIWPLAVATLALAACGDDGANTTADSVDPAATSDPGITPPATDVADDTAPGDDTITTDTSTDTSTAPSPSEIEATDTSAPAADGIRVVETSNGPVDVPADPQQVTVLDEYAAMSLLAVGVTPAVVYGAYQSEVGQHILTEAGVEIREVGGTGAPNLEDVASTRPDLIVHSTEGGLADVHDELSAIAPTIELPYTVPWREAILASGRVVGNEAEATRLIGILEHEIDDLAADVATDPRSLSILGDTYGMVFAASTTSPMAGLLEEVGFTRPPAQANGTPDPMFEAAIMISTEQLSDHDADEVIVLRGAFYDEQTILDAPTFQILPAVQDGRTVIVDGDMWFGTFPFAVYWTLQDLRAIHAGEGQDAIATIDDLDERWAEYQDLVS